MAKVKSSAKWNGLSDEQRSTLEEWLFEDRLSYGKAAERARKELKFTGSRSSVRRFYERRAGERMLEGFVESGTLKASVDSAPVDVEGLRSSGMKVAAQVFFRMVTQKPEELKAWLPLAKLLAQCEKNASWRAVKDEENGIRREALRFARVRFQYDTMGEAMRALPELQDLKEAQAEAEMTVYEKNKRMNDLRRRMFGDAIPELLPESEEEEAHPEIIERNFQAARQRQNEQWAREYRERQKEQARSEATPALTPALSPGRGRKKQPGNVQSGAAPVAESAGEESEETVRTEGNEENEGAKPDGKEREDAGGGPVGKQGDEAQGITGTGAKTEAREVFSDEPRKLTAEERQKNYEDLMRRARGQWRQGDV